MGVWILQQYDLARGLHIIAVIAWMAGMMYLPRLYIYHLTAPPGSQMDETFKVMERRLMRGIINPAMIIAFLFGLLLIWIDGHLRGWDFLLRPWMLTKLAGVVFLVSWHGFLSRARRRFETGTNQRSDRFWRAVNELPFVAAIIMVIAVTTEFGN
jgi:putative membrane protein